MKHRLLLRKTFGHSIQNSMKISEFEAEHYLLNVFYKLLFKQTNIFQGEKMKILDKVELIVRLKEKIEETKKENKKAAQKLQMLLETIIRSGEYKAI